jgi:hypothetical protein
MHRFAAIVLCALATAGLTAAPAPPHRPWFTDWAKPVDPVGACCFDRKRNGLTITIPAKDHILDAAGGGMNAPRLLRTVRGDFVVQVRVAGDFRLSDQGRLRSAGLCLTWGKKYVTIHRMAVNPLSSVGHEAGADRLCICKEVDPGEGICRMYKGPSSAKPTYLRLARHGMTLRFTFSEDGKKWEHLRDLRIELTREVKVGVFAETLGPEVFQPKFDRFKLSFPRK